jgi:hypothetical protein
VSFWSGRERRRFSLLLQGILTAAVLDTSKHYNTALKLELQRARPPLIRRSLTCRSNFWLLLLLLPQRCWYLHRALEVMLGFPHTPSSGTTRRLVDQGHHDLILMRYVVETLQGPTIPAQASERFSIILKDILSSKSTLAIENCSWAMTLPAQTQC